MKPDPIGVNCFLTELDDGNFLVKSSNTGPLIQKGRYFGPGPFELTKREDGTDIVTIEMPTAEEVTPTGVTPTPVLAIWIPVLANSVSFSIGGTPETLTLTAEASITDTGLTPPDPALSYSLCDEFTEFRVEVSIDAGDHTWSDISLADNSALSDPVPYDIEMTSTEMETTIRYKVLIDATNQLLYEVLYTFQFGVTGSDPTATSIVYVYPGSWLE